MQSRSLVVDIFGVEICLGNQKFKLPPIHIICLIFEYVVRNIKPYSGGGEHESGMTTSGRPTGKSMSGFDDVITAAAPVWRNASINPLTPASSVISPVSLADIDLEIQPIRHSRPPHGETYHPAKTKAESATCMNKTNPNR